MPLFTSQQPDTSESRIRCFEGSVFLKALMENLTTKIQACCLANTGKNNQERRFSKIAKDPTEFLYEPHIRHE